jgi:hypothetical protein
MAKQQLGYIFVDHRASPGLPEDVARAAGYDPKLCGEGKLFEADTLTCKHCKVPVVKNPERVRERHSCLKCGGKFICDPCAYLTTLPGYTHAPFEAVIAAHVDAAAHQCAVILPPGWQEPQGAPAKLILP